MTKKLLLGSFLFFLTCLSAKAQNASVHDIALGAVSQVSALGNLNYTTPLSGALITVCSVNATGIPCTPTVPLCSSEVDTSCLQPNPFNADISGNYSFWVPGGKTYVVTVSSTGYTSRVVIYTAPIDPSGPVTISGLLTVNNGITGSGNTGTLAPGSGILGVTNNYTAQQNFSTTNAPAVVGTNTHTNTNTGSPEHGLESNCNITVNNARCYGLVMSAGDQPGLTGTHPVGGVALVNAPNHNSAYASQGVYGFVAQANFGNGTTDNGTIYTGYGFRVEWQNPAVATGMWNVGFGTSDGVASLGFLLGSQTVYSGPAVGSQYGYFLNYDSGGVQHLSSIGADPFGNLALNAFTGHTSIPNGIDFQEQSSNATSTWGSGWDVCGGNSTQQALVCSYHGDAFAVVPRITGAVTPGDTVLWADATHIKDGGPPTPAISVYCTPVSMSGNVSGNSGIVNALGASVSCTMPSTGCPCRALINWNVEVTLTTNTQISFWVNDGSHNFRFVHVNGQTSDATGASQGLVTPVTYSNGAVVTFALETEGGSGANYTIIAADPVGSGASSGMDVSIFKSN